MYTLCVRMENGSEHYKEILGRNIMTLLHYARKLGLSAWVIRWNLHNDHVEAAYEIIQGRLTRYDY